MENEYKPPFTITEEIMNLVAEISELTGMIIVSEKLENLILRKGNRIKEIE